MSLFTPVNFRDVGEMVQIISDFSNLPVNVLYRGGKIDEFNIPSHIGKSRTIINLRRGKDPIMEGVKNIHIPAQNSVDNYNTFDQSVRYWIKSTIHAILDINNIGPYYIHCTSGRDRTGIIVAALLYILGTSADCIREEYMLSDNTHIDLINKALDGFRHWVTLKSDYYDLLVNKITATST